jgi:hypothetical protein
MRPIRIPKHPLLLSRFGLNALRSCSELVNRTGSHQGSDHLVGAPARVQSVTYW